MANSIATARAFRRLEAELCEQGISLTSGVGTGGGGSVRGCTRGDGLSTWSRVYYRGNCQCGEGADAADCPWGRGPAAKEPSAVGLPGMVADLLADCRWDSVKRQGRVGETDGDTVLCDCATREEGIAECGVHRG